MVWHNLASNGGLGVSIEVFFSNVSEGKPVVGVISALAGTLLFAAHHYTKSKLERQANAALDARLPSADSRDYLNAELSSLWKPRFMANAAGYLTTLSVEGNSPTQVILFTGVGLAIAADSEERMSQIGSNVAKAVESPDDPPRDFNYARR